MKRSGIGMNLYVEGRDLSGDVGAIGTLSNPVNLLDFTGINKNAMERGSGIRDSTLSFTAFFNPETSPEAEHAVLKTLGEKGVMVTVGTNLGDPTWSTKFQQGDYPATRAADGSFVFTPTFSGSDGNMAEWGVLLTTGVQQDNAAAVSPGIVDAAESEFGGVGWLHAFGIGTGTATVKIQDSNDTTDGIDGSWADLLTFTLTSAGAPASERKEVTGTVNKGLKVVTTGSFTNFRFAVAFRRASESDLLDLS